MQARGPGNICIVELGGAAEGRGGSPPAVWPDPYVRLDGQERDFDADEATLVAEIRSWLSSIVQVEHLALLVGNGLTTAVAAAAGVKPPSMSLISFGLDSEEKVNAAASAAAEAMGRGEPNIEDQLRVAMALAEGLSIIDDDQAGAWSSAINDALRRLADSVLGVEAELNERLAEKHGGRLSDAGYLLVNFLLALANRGTSRERLHIFTTNYDRILEHGCDIAGLRVLDRFIGVLEPIFRASRVDVDLHYNPPGIRGEPRYLEGVIRLTKLHGSLDWRAHGAALRRIALPFGGSTPAGDAGKSAIIYPNPAKDIETSEYPYAELFRDFSAALCRPNSALITYGYGFGDDHVNRVIGDMLTVPSTHLVVISYDGAGGRIQRFVERHGHPRQVTVLIGSKLATLDRLVRDLLPAAAAERIASRRHVPGSEAHDDSHDKSS